MVESNEEVQELSKQIEIHMGERIHDAAALQQGTHQLLSLFVVYIIRTVRTLHRLI